MWTPPQPIIDLQHQVNLLMARTDDAENRLRSNNVQVVGLPEGVTGDNPATFSESFFKQALSLQRVSPAYQVERAHRVPTGGRIPGTTSHAFLGHFNFGDRDLILSEARKQQTICYDSSALHFFPNLSPELQKCRRSFVEVRKKLWEKGLQYSMLSQQDESP